MNRRLRKAFELEPGVARLPLAGIAVKPPNGADTKLAAFS
jgi:hypothetical protein